MTKKIDEKLSVKNLAAVDIGTNSFHLIVVEVKDNGHFQIIDREKEVIRLGEGSKGDIKNISEAAIERALASLKRFKGIADSHRAALKAFATSAVREASNKNDFIRRVFENTDIEINVISGLEEARLIYLGILKAVPVFKKQILCIDIGGGSTEFLLGKEGNIIYSNSLKLGAVRLTQRFFPDFIITESRVKGCREWVKGVLVPLVRNLNNKKIEIAVGSSGTIHAAGSIILANLKNDSSKVKTLNNFKFTFKELKKAEEIILTQATVEKREKIEGLDPRRTDIIPAGIIILTTIFETLNLSEMKISDYALREGIIIDTLQKSDNKYSVELLNIRRASIEQLAQSCKYDREHCNHVAELAVNLFNELKTLHQLEDNYEEYLEMAAKLHDIGYHISHSQHHRHGQYIIKNSELLGFNYSEINIIANVARYHRKSHPKNKHSDFSSLTEKNKIIVKKLSSILRIADAFDRNHKKNVIEIKADIGDKIVLLNVFYLNEYPEIEVWSFNRRKMLFEEIFEKKIELKIIPIE